MSLNEMNLVWIDLEMTGLNPDKDTILEIAAIVADGDLNILAEGPTIAVRQPEEALEAMDEWCKTQHAKSGLLDRVRTEGATMAEAERRTLEFIAQYAPRRASPMCGNSICQDRRFLYRHMPELEAYFHYRNLDVSTIKELARRWAPDVFSGLVKKGTHLALDDIRESIEELRYYRAKMFREF